MSTRITRSQVQKLSMQLQIESSSINECGVFNIIEVDYDGDCLFSSILDFVEKNKDCFKEAPQTANQIRSQAVDYILSRNSIGFQQNWDRFVGNIKFNLETRITGFSNYGSNDKADELIKLAYRSYMSKPGTFGTFSELTAAAEFYGFKETNSIITFATSLDQPVIPLLIGKNRRYSYYSLAPQMPVTFVD